MALHEKAFWHSKNERLPRRPAKAGLLAMTASGFLIGLFDTD